MKTRYLLCKWFIYISILSVVSIVVLHFFVIDAPPVIRTDNGTALQDICAKRELARYGFTTLTCQKDIDLDLIVSGGPGKDGIPALYNPRFVSYEQSTMPDNARGILININNTQRFYPYNILVWHEIINDTIDNTHYAVTFCPLCDSGIVMNRKIYDKVLQFGVSGLLFQSNLLMYDTSTQSLWSQARQKAVLGPYTGTKLDILPFQLLTFREARRMYPNGVILSTNTGVYSEDRYQSTPYGGYLENPDTFFPVSVRDNRFPAKELMYVVPFNNRSVAMPYRALQQGTRTLQIGDKRLTITRTKDEIRATHNNTIYPGYFELWFSWATHHQRDGIVLK